MAITSQRRRFIPLIFACITLWVSCGPKTDEDQIRELMKEAGQHIEKKDITGLMGLLSDDYADFRGRDKTQTRDMVQTYFQEFRGIVIHVLGTRIDGINFEEAIIQTDAALSSGGAKALRKLLPVSTDNYRFMIKLTKKGDRWLIRYAEWKHIGIEELFPESLSILKKLFPDR
jgi:hypothetical protein